MSDFKMIRSNDVGCDVYVNTAAIMDITIQDNGDLTLRLVNGRSHRVKAGTHADQARLQFALAAPVLAKPRKTLPS